VKLIKWIFHCGFVFTDLLYFLLLRLDSFLFLFFLCVDCSNWTHNMEVAVLFICLDVWSFKHVTDFYKTSHGKCPPGVIGQNSFLWAQISDPAPDRVSQKQYIVQKGVHYRICMSLERTPLILIFPVDGLCPVKYGKNIVDNVKNSVYISTVNSMIKHTVLCTVFSIPLIGFVNSSWINEFLNAYLKTHPKADAIERTA
jgi:hypothetical protein